MKKRIIALLLAVVMLLGYVPVPATATEHTHPTFVVDTVTASAGETVDVTIRLENNPGITSIKLKVEYADGLTLVGVTGNPDLGRNFLVSPDGVYPVILNWYDGLADVTGDWVFATLQFTVADGADAGEYPVTISYNPNDVFDVNEDNVSFEIANGAVVVDSHYGRQQLAGMSNAKALLYAYDRIVAGIEASAEHIEVYNGADPLSVTELQMVMDVYGRDYAHHFWMDNGYSYSSDPSGVVSLMPRYVLSGSELETAKAAFEQKVAGILEGLTDSMSEFERELYIHDRLAEIITYANGDNAHNAYGALVEGKAVCEGYAEALQYLLQRAGIQSFIALGSSINPTTNSSEGHAWNYVRIDGEYYHVDLTWNDQDENLFHAYFNQTDAVIREDHAVSEVSYTLPTCDSVDAQYFTGKDTYLDDYTVAEVGRLLKNNGLTVHVYLPGDVDGFITWYYTNIVDIAIEAGISGGFSYGYTRLGRELILAITTTACDHSELTLQAGADASCTADGYKAYYKCSCGKYFEDSSASVEITDLAAWKTGAGKIPASHDLTEVPATEATCDKDGNVAYFTCDCGKWFWDAEAKQGIADKNSVVIKALNHSFTNYVSDNNATCAQDGTETAKCDHCEETDTRVISGSREDAAHTFPVEYTPDGNADCTTDGTKSRVCTTCGEKETVTDEGSALGHNYQSGVCTMCGVSIWDLNGNGVLDILTIGNSHTANYTEFIPKVLTDLYADGLETKISLTKATIGSIGLYSGRNSNANATYRSHLEAMNNGASAYSYLSKKQYDLVIVQDYMESLVDDPAVFADGLASVIEKINEIATENGFAEPQVAWFADWVDIRSSGGDTALRDGEGNKISLPKLTREETYQKSLASIAEVEARIAAGSDNMPTFVIHASTIKQNAMSSYLGTTKLWENQKYCLLESDTTHMTNELGKYLMAAGAVSEIVGYYADYLALGQSGTNIGAALTLQNGPAVSGTGSQYEGAVNAEILEIIRESIALPVVFKQSAYVTDPIDGYVSAFQNIAWNYDDFTDQESALVSIRRQIDAVIGGEIDAYSVEITEFTSVDQMTIKVRLLHGYSLKEIEKVLHHCVYSATVTAPTCTEEGYTTHTCHCGDSYVDSKVDALGHKLGDWETTKDATCTEDGSKRCDCARCDYFETEVIEATGHKYEEVVTAPTCTEDGYTTHTCHCGDSYVDSKVDALGHEYGEWTEVKAPTCDTEGQDKRVCDTCGDVQYRDTRISGDSNKILVSNPVAENHYAGKKMVFLGDSVTWGSFIDTVRTDAYPYVVGNSLGATVSNKAVSGSAICTGGHVTVNETMTYDKIKGADVVTILLGVNDFNHAVKNGMWQGAQKYDPAASYYDLGDYNSTDTSEYYGALRAWCEKIAEFKAMPEFENTEFIFITMPASGMNRSVSKVNDWDQSKVNIHGRTLREYCTAIMEICAEYGIPVFDANMYSGIYYNSPEDNNVDLTGGDGVHPSAAGHALIAQSLEEFLLEGYTYENRTVADCGHRYETVITQPTCTEDGYTTHKCPVCHYSYTDNYVDALGHKYESVVTAPTCKKAGYTTHTCTVCDDSYVDGYVAALGHDYQAVVTAPTCTEQGYTTHTCHCGDSYVDSKVDALGHKLGDWETVKAATCTEDGSQRRDCERCDYFETEVIEATGHKYESVVIAPTCTEEGYTTHTCHCGDSYVDSKVDALGHKLGDWETVKAATCTEDGSKRRDCDRCDYFETEVVEATGHKYESVVTAPTCTEDGYTTHTCHCGDSYVSDYVDALGHKLGDWETVKAATCTDDGSKRRDCDRCDYFETEVIEATGHKYEEVVTAPTCTEEGYTTHTCHCGESYVDSKVDALGHEYGEWTEVKASTCTEKGSERRDCANCDHFETRDVAATGHKYESVVTAPTCTEDGYTTHTCHCGDSYVDSKVDALGHKLGDWETVKAATCTEDGSKRRDCERCDYFETEVIEATGHKYEAVVTAPTCTEDGYTTHTCHCGDSYVDSKVDALGHKLGDWETTKDATCTEDGSQRRDCDRCDYFETEVIEAIGHKYETVVTAPTCTEDGYTTHTCHCGDSYVDSKVDALGHDWDAGVVTKEPTETETGTRLHNCNRCDETKTVTVPTLDHVHKYEAVVTAPTCTAQGYTTHTCRCGESFVDSYVAATGHKYETVVTAPTTITQGYTTYTCHCGDVYVADYVDELGHYHATAEQLDSGESLVLTELNVIKHNKALIFSANVENLGDGLIRLSHGQKSYAGGYVEITAEQVIVYTVNNSVTSKTYAHGLDISGDIHVRIELERSNAVLTITTASGKYSRNIGTTGCNGEIACSVENATLTDVDLRWFAKGVESDYWFFGDSWFSTNSAARWTKYLLDDGYTDVLLGAYGGMGASTALKQFKELLPIDTPEYAVWVMGMNNGDRNGVINASWLSATEEFLALCEEYGITPILSTIPTTPKVNNRLKNAWIKASGYQYIDFDLALVENHTTGEWFEGTAASDLNHPTTEGAKMLYPQVFADFPELAKADPATCTHKLHLLGERNADCVNGGRTAYYVCSLCAGAFLDEAGTVTTTTAENLLAPLGHSFGQWTEVTAPTCTANGSERRDCENCDHYETREIAATGHKYESVVTAPTCKKAGYTTHTCTVCDDSYVDGYVAALGHDYQAVVTAPTCTEQGYTTHTCHCGDEYVDSYVAATGHSFGQWAEVTASTCTAKGSERRDCANCDHYETREIEATGHKYESVVTAPTCTEDGYTTHTCHCGDSYVDSKVDALGHKLGDWETVKAATCTEDGSKRRDCDRCDYSETETINATGHKYETVVTAPTCTEQGYTTHTCHCGERFVDSYVAATGHSFGAWTEVKAPTCTEKGSERRDCANCDHFETRDVAATGHKYESVVTAPTCTEDGYTTHTCHCGDCYVDSKIDALGHKLGNWETVKDATCTEDGSKRRDCDRCDYFETEVIEATGHKYEEVVTAPTCTEEGYTTHTCHCGDSYVDSKVDALGHKLGDWETTKDANCTEDGSKRRDCDRCDYFETEVIEATGHKYEAVVTAPTCTEEGYTTHTCHCGESFVDSKVDTLGHKLGNWGTVKAATCTEDGSQRRDCEHCDYFETEVIEATGHKYEEVVTVPTCTEDGYTTHTCHCGDSYVSDYVDALGHKLGNWETVKDATCTEDGSKRRDCERCDYFETEVIKAAGHKYEAVVTAPTCTEDGYTTHTCHCGDSYVDSKVDALGHKLGDWETVKDATCTEDGSQRRDCERCDYFETEVIEATGHKYEAVVTAPTCTAQGYTTHTCHCGDSYVDSKVDALGHKLGDWETVKDATCTEDGSQRRDCDRCDYFETEVIEATGHKYEEVVTAPTCTEDGYTTYACECGDSYVSDYVDALGHKLGDWETVKDATCTEKGSERRDCANCDHYETREIEATGHKYESVVTAPTCTEDGYTTYACECGDSYVSDYVDALGHDLVSYPEQKPTCVKDGWEAYEACSRCEYTNCQPIPAKGHQYSDTVIPPTCTAEGYTLRECTVCGINSVVDYVDALGHKEVILKAVAPTCTATGLTEGSYCASCGKIFAAQQVVAALGHSYKSVATAPTCTKEGYTTYTCHCGHSYVDNKVSALGHKLGQWTVFAEPKPDADGEERRTCQRCDFYESRKVAYPGIMLKLEGEDLTKQKEVWIEGMPYPVITVGNNKYVELRDEKDFVMVTYTYQNADNPDVHTQYPTGMKVYKVSGGKITHIKELDNLLQYSGSSIRITGKKGIRMITSITKANKTALTGKGLAGYKLVEYGTALCWASEIKEGDALTLGKTFTRSNYAYKRGVADPIFATTKDLVQYTNVLVGFTNDQCKDDIAMRPYIILEDAKGEKITLYGGTVYRSIGYIAYQNRSVVKTGTEAYKYVWDIIHYVYGNKYDADYKG